MNEKAWELYKKLDCPPHMERCPCCASPAELWQYSTAIDAPATKVVMCSNGEAFGPQDGIANEGCILFMPPDDFYKATIREAAKYWNEYAKALTAQQRKRRWEIAQVLRGATPAPEPVQVEQHCPGGLPKCKWVDTKPFGSKCTTCGDSIPF